MADTKTAHTPGPWRVASSNPHLITSGLSRDPRDAACHFVAEVFAVDEVGRMAANARLIAEAPELLALAEYVLEHPHAARGAGDEPHAQWAEMQAIAWSVLAKVKAAA